MRIAPLALLLLASPLAAQKAEMPKSPPGAPILARVEAGTYAADPDHTQILFHVNHLGFSEYDGAFGGATGTLVLDPRNPGAAKVDIAIPTAGITTTSAKLDEHLKSADFFDAAKFPGARFVSTKVTAVGATAKIEGMLTLHGVTKPVTLAVRFIGAGPHPMTKKTAIGFRATTRVKRSDFGIGYGVPMVSDMVDLTINAAFDRQ